jgi:hypothetical protein
MRNTTPVNLKKTLSISFSANPHQISIGILWEAIKIFFKSPLNSLSFTNFLFFCVNKVVPKFRVKCGSKGIKGKGISASGLHFSRPFTYPSILPYSFTLSSLTLSSPIPFHNSPTNGSTFFAGGRGLLHRYIVWKYMVIGLRY